MSRDRRRTLTDDERVLWSTFTKQITPLADRPAAVDEVTVTARPVLRSTRAAVPQLAPVAPAPAQHRREPATVPALGRRERARVARGKQQIGGRIDLHGMTQDEAHGALLRFIRQASDRDAKLVLVITGKGTRDGVRGVLKRQVPHWLALPEFRSLVIGFEDAHIKHGGEGALYVRVRRTDRMP